MDFQSVMETIAEAWVAANTQTPLTEAAEQGLINGPTNLVHGSSGSFVPIIQDLSNEKREQDILIDHDNNRNPGQQSSSDSQSSCPILSELRTPYKGSSSPHGKSMPVHCIVEQSPGPQSCGQYVELDSYAIVPADTLFSELVRTALVKLGYSVSQILGAKGAIQIKKWKPLAFDQITENTEATVTDILGDLTTVATLHIRLYSVPDNPQDWIDTTVRNAVLELLREMSQSKLSKLCPLSQPMLSNIINNRYVGKIGKEKCQEFGRWYLNYRKENPESVAPEIVPSDRPQDGRLTFHPTKELPTMRNWFKSCRSPSKRTLQMYVDILNQGPVRQQERPKVVLSTLKNWWKNEKQRERKNGKCDEGLNSLTKVKKKIKIKETYKQKDTCSNQLQELSVVDPNRLAELNKYAAVNHGNELENELYRFQRREDLLMVHNPSVISTHKIASLSDSLLNKDTVIEESNVFDKFQTVCVSQSHVIYHHIPDSQKTYNGEITNDIHSIPTSVAPKNTKN